MSDLSVDVDLGGLSAISSVASAIGMGGLLPNPKPPAPETEDPPITSNFHVIIDGMSLGRWTECSGLGIKYKTSPQVPAGGTTSAQLLFQKELQTLTLTRPFGSASIDLLHWFEFYGHVTVPLTATVYICDYEGNPLYYWELSNVVPVEWNGPKFKSGEAAAATEVLKLTYTDFASYGQGDGSGSGNMAMELAGDIIGATLGQPRLLLLGTLSALVGDIITGGGLTFDIIPNTFTITSGLKIPAKPGVSQVPRTNSAAQGLQSQDRKLSFDFILDCLTLGTNPLKAAEAATVGIIPQLEFLAMATGNGLFSPDLGSMLLSLIPDFSTAPPKVQFIWGAFMFQGAVTSCSMKINVLSEMGIPQRATVSLTIQEYLSSLPGTNPTSGASGATRTHTVVAGDTLASIAFTAYGHADRWRRIAELNGIDDPMRLRPGTTLLLPKAEDARAGK
jgi:phage tail-like protein